MRTYPTSAAIPSTSAASTGTGPTAILSALPEEQQGLLELLHGASKIVVAGRDFWCGELSGQPVVLALSRIGKVSATITASALITQLHAERIIFTGVAGGWGEGVKVGDVVVAREFIQHDLDVSPLFPRYEVPSYGRSRFACDAQLSALLVSCACEALSNLSNASHAGTVHEGLIASGDRFVSSAIESKALQAALRSSGHEALAVEMEGAAVAQVCADYDIPFAAMRTISDRADDDAHLDFPKFVRDVASRYALAILTRFMQALKSAPPTPA
jgi:adenosylhomocysteine nucleosidase